jgi:hypothetical protein
VVGRQSEPEAAKTAFAADRILAARSRYAGLARLPPTPARLLISAIHPCATAATARLKPGII